MANASKCEFDTALSNSHLVVLIHQPMQFRGVQDNQFSQLTDGKAPIMLLGVVVAGYCFTQFFMSPIFGFWSDQRPIKEPLIACFLGSFVANIAYSYASALPNGGQYLVLVARMMMGGCAGERCLLHNAL